MRYAATSIRAQFVLLAAIGLTSATNLQLTSVQPIAGFSSSCFTAYSQRLPSCAFDDLLSSVGGKNGGCSISCIADLQAAQADVQAACQGERASRQTVIGQMFLGTVVGFLCGNDVGGGAAGSQSSSQTTTTTTIAAPTTTMSTAAPIDTTSTSQSAQTESTTSSETSVSTTTTAQESQSSSTSTTSTAAPTQTPNNNNNGGGSGEDGTSTTFDGAGGGSPFDGGPGDFDGAASTLLSGHTSYLSAAITSMLLLLLR